MAAMRSRTRRVVSAPASSLRDAGSDLEREPVVRACVLTGDRRKLCLRCGAERLLRIPRNGHGGSGISRDGVAAHSAVERRKLEWRRLERRGEDARERLDRVHAPSCDVAAGVTALRAGDLDPQRDVIRRDG